MVPSPAADARQESPTSSAPDAWRIEVFRAPEADDPEGESARQALSELGLAPARVRVGKGYLLSPSYRREAVERVAAELLADPLIDVVRIAAPRAASEPQALHRVVAMPRPGVMDPIAQTVERLLVDTGNVPARGAPGVATYRVFEVGDEVSRAALEVAAGRVLANEVIEIVRIDRDDLPYGVPFPSSRRGRVDVALRAADDGELARISREGSLSLSLDEMRAIRAHFEELDREPTACELETLAQTWSEHCKHKTLTGIIEVEREGLKSERIDNLLKSTIVRATRELDRPWCVSVFVDNAGIVRFDELHDLAIKVETHNHPSAIDPYGGAGTGIGGVVRDVLGAGLGARPIANVDCFFVGPLDLPSEDVPKGTMHPRRILRGVVAGVRDYGNRMGIPTVSGGVWYHPGYVANPLVYAGTVGILPADHARKEVRPGDVIVAVGGRTGRDGIHGATFSSIELSQDSETVSSAAVQIGDPITEKRVLDCLLVARDRGLYRALTDCGAGGFSSAVGEMGEETGAEVELERVPLKYAGLSSHEIWISEAQERMVLAVPPERLAALLAVFAAEDVEATAIGRFTDDGRLVVKDGGEVVADLSMDFLHRGTPRPVRRAAWRRPALPDPGAPRPDDFGATIVALVGAPDVASKEGIIRQYDHEVQGFSVLKPLVGVFADGPGDAAVLQPVAGSTRGVALACGANPRYGELDPYAMAAAAIDEAVRNVVAVGADPARAAILDNFSWGNCDKPDRLGALVLAAEACYDTAVAYGTPFVSGKDSLNNEYRLGDETLSIPPTLLVTCLAIVPNVARAVSSDLKRAGNPLYLVGSTRAELGGSQLHLLRGARGGQVPRPDLELAPRLFAALASASQAGLVAACHDLSEGGLAVTAAEMAIGGDLGLELELALVDAHDLAPDYDADTTLLFSESCSRFLVEVPSEHSAAFESRFEDLPCAPIGCVNRARTLVVRGVEGEEIVSVSVDDLRTAFRSGFRA